MVTEKDRINLCLSPGTRQGRRAAKKKLSVPSQSVRSSLLCLQVGGKVFVKSFFDRSSSSMVLPVLPGTAAEREGEADVEEQGSGGDNEVRPNLSPPSSPVDG